MVYFIAQALEEQGLDLVYIDQLQQTRLLMNKVLNRISTIAGKRSPLPAERTMHMARLMGHEIAAHAERTGSDIIFSPSSIPLAMLRCDKPKVFYTDATFDNLLEDYIEFADYPRHQIEEGHELEYLALQNCDLAIYASRWAAQSAIKRYGTDPAKVKVVPFGSNITDPPDRQTVMRAIDDRRSDKCELLFIGVNWERKGGPLAWEIARLLNESGMPTRLTVLGCEPPVGFNAPFMEVVSFLTKDSVNEQEQLTELLLHSHFMLVPSVAECFGLVYAEASSMGLPSIGRNVGGVCEAVHDGKNGLLFRPEDGAEAYVDRILSFMKDKDAYVRMAKNSYDVHIEKLNWNTSAATLRGLMSELL